MLDNFQYAGFEIQFAVPHLCTIIMQDENGKYFKQFGTDGDEVLHIPLPKDLLEICADRIYLFSNAEKSAVNRKYKIGSEFIAFYLGADVERGGAYVCQQPEFRHFSFGTKQDVGDALEQGENWTRLTRHYWDAYEHLDLLNDNDKKAIFIENKLLSYIKTGTGLSSTRAEEMIKKRNTFYL